MTVSTDGEFIVSESVGHDLPMFFLFVGDNVVMKMSVNCSGGCHKDREALWCGVGLHHQLSLATSETFLYPSIV